MIRLPPTPQFFPAVALFDCQAPEPLQVSGLSHAPEEESPQAVPAVLNPLSWQAPLASHPSLVWHPVPASPQVAPAVAWVDWQAPEALHGSGLAPRPEDRSSP